MPVLEAQDLYLGFARKQVVENLNLRIQQGKILSILGPNGSGKSTVLKALARNLKPMQGIVRLKGQDIRKLSARHVARQLAVLPQSPQAPEDITVKELAAYGRFPHQSWWYANTVEDRAMVDWALRQTGLKPLADRAITSLSGGERQRAWIAMALAQKTEILLLDEPTTHLDICHQMEILELVADLNRCYGLTVVMVLHDINQAAKYSDQILILKDGKIFAHGIPADVISVHLLREVFGVETEVWLDGQTGKPLSMVRGLVKDRG